MSLIMRNSPNRGEDDSVEMSSKKCAAFLRQLDEEMESKTLNSVGSTPQQHVQQ